jgi:hypothetical protein
VPGAGFQGLHRKRRYAGPVYQTRRS